VNLENKAKLSLSMCKNRQDSVDVLQSFSSEERGAGTSSPFGTGEIINASTVLGPGFTPNAVNLFSRRA